jgi:hypothetical protein
MKKLLLLILLPTIMFSQRWEIKDKWDGVDNYDVLEVIEALDFANEVRFQAELKPLILSNRLSKLAKSRLDSISINGEYIASTDETGEIYFHTDRIRKNHFKNAVIGLIIPGKDDNFTYDQVTCFECTEIGFAKAKIDDRTYTMLIFDKIY